MITALGYIGVRSDRLSDWSDFASGLLGMQGIDRAGKQLAFRMDNRHQRLLITGGLNRGPFQKSNSVTVLYEHARALAAELGFELGDTFSGGGSDGNFTAPIAPTLDGLGVDGDGAHTLNEHIYISSLVPRMLLLRRLFETLT